MKRFFPLLVALFMAAGVTSCLDWDDEEEPSFLTWATITSNEKAPTLKADNGVILHALNNVDTDTTFYEVGDRVYFSLPWVHVSGQWKRLPIYVANYMSSKPRNIVTIDHDYNDCTTLFPCQGSTRPSFPVVISTASSTCCFLQFRKHRGTVAL
jgi:hypothetical protein